MPTPRKDPKLQAKLGNPSRIKLQAAPEGNWLSKTPPPPTWLTKEAKAEWRKVAPILVQQSVLREVDLPSLAVYCQSVADLAQYTKLIQDDPKFGPLRNKAIDYIYKFGSAFGLNPAARTRVTIDKPVANPLQQFNQRVQK